MAERNTRVRASQIISIKPSDVDATNGSTDGYAPVKASGQDKFTWVATSGSDPQVDKNTDNIILNAFRLQINSSLSVLNYEDGFTDEYEDETGIDGASSTNESYDTTDDYYHPGNSVGSDVKLLLHCNGSDASTTFTDDSPSSHTVTAQGDAQLDTAQYKFGTASGLFDGTGDYLTIPDSTDWDVTGSNSDNWTIDFWAKINSLGSFYNFIDQAEDTDNFWNIAINTNDDIKFQYKSNSSTILNMTSDTSITDSNWHHIALCKVGNEFGLYLDGDQVAYGTTDTTDTFSASLAIGARNNGDNPYNGWMDEIRIQHNNYFSATPNSTPDDTITVPTAEFGGTIANMTLISNSQTAESAPSEARIIILEEDVDAITLNTDLKAYISRDGGSTWAQVTLTDEGDFDASKRILVGTADLSASGIGSGTNMEYKIETLNTKDLKLHATGMVWS